MPTFTLRAARRSDLGALVALEDIAFASDRLAARSFRRRVESGPAVCRQLRRGGQLAGYSRLLFRASARVARLYSVAVHPAWRGQGLAARLMKDAERQARKRRCRALRLEVREDNLPAIRLYEQSGYRRIGRHPGYYADGASAIRFEKSVLARRTSDAESDEDRSPGDGPTIAPYMNADSGDRHAASRPMLIARPPRRRPDPLEAPQPRRPHQDRGSWPTG